MLLVIDNYDSFAHNLARYLSRLHSEVRVVRNDAVSCQEVAELAPGAIILSPGPCAPAQAGICVELVRQFYSTIPLLGVCLGHQCIGEAFGGQVCRSDAPVHGKSSKIIHSQQDLFDQLPNPMSVGRYHSLVVDDDSLPNELRVDARLEDGTIMAFHHHRFPVFGVQFHPESILTESGYALLQNFLKRANLATDQACPTLDDERKVATSPSFRLPSRPVTF